MSEIDERDSELRNLWSCRPDLDENGWSRLYQITISVLKNYKPRELAGLPEEREVYIQDFFEDKVFRLDSLSRCDHAGALRIYYLNYLRDLIRGRQSRAKWEISDKHDPDDDSPPSLDEAPDIEADHRDLFAELEDAGFIPAQVAASAATWLATNEEWVRIFVAFSNCPDAALSEPLVRLAKRKGIKSQAYKAEQLGFNWKKADLAGFANTLLGRWITESVGIELRPENSPLVLGVLNILCLEALLWAEQQEAAE